MRRPAPAPIIATVALVLAAAPVGQAADGWVKRALFARNAAAVDGFHASRTPHQGKLIVLPRSGKLPASILPAVARGPAGPPGSDGADGSGGSAVVSSPVAAITITGAQTGVVTLPLKAGTYGDQIDADLSASSDDPVALVTAHTFAAAGGVTLTCAADDDGVVASDARLVALRVTTLSSS